MIYIQITIDDNGEYKDLQSITIHLQPTKMAITRIYNQLQSIYNDLQQQ